MNFKQKRMSYGLEAYTVAKELGIPYTKYLEVEKGKLDLDINKKEKFSEIMSRSGELKAETYSKYQQIYEDWKKGAFKEMMIKKGYTVTKLSRDMGIPQPTLSAIINKFEGSKSLKEYTYDFLKDPMNMPSEKPKKAKQTSKEKKQNLNISCDELYEQIINKYSFKCVVGLYNLIKQNFENIN